jgi:hypothetical protein
MAGVRQRLNVDQLKEWARSGAEATLKRLRAEIIAIERTFPELALSRRRRAVRRSVAKVRKQGRQMSAAARAEVEKRMKRYSAERKKAKAKVK